jgi:CRP-like cAMP-binding protein
MFDLGFWLGGKTAFRLPWAASRAGFDQVLTDTLRRLSKLVCLNSREIGNYSGCCRREVRKLINELLSDG